MNVLIRTDASEQIGSGHVMRCLTLADGLRDRGARIKFSCSRLKGHLNDLISLRGYEVVPPLEKRGGGDLLIVDHYDLDEQWEKAQRKYYNKILVIDDLANRNHDCDLLLDQNLVANWKTRYTHRVPANCKLLLGPQYALLPPIYTELHDRIPPREGQIKRILVAFGGGEHRELYAKIEADIRSLNRPDIQVDYARPGKFPNLVSQKTQADLAIGGCGTSTWERLCLGLPALVVTVASNQRETAKELNHRELIQWYELSRLSNLIESDLDGNWSKRCADIVDGKGLERVLSVLMADKDMPLCVRHAKLDDENWLLELANDSVTRGNSFSLEKVSPETHRVWFYKRLRDIKSCCFYVIETADKVPVGQVRFEQKVDMKWELHYALAPAYRGVGLGRIVLGRAIAELGKSYPDAQVYGHIKADNIASHKIFRALGLL